MEKSNIEQVDCWSLGASSSCHHTSGQPFLSNKQVNKQTNKHTNKEIQSLGFGTAPFQKIKKPTNMIGRQCCHENLGIIVHCTMLNRTEKGVLELIERGLFLIGSVDFSSLPLVSEQTLLIPTSPLVSFSRESKREKLGKLFFVTKSSKCYIYYIAGKRFVVLIRKASSLFFSFWILQSQ